MFVVNLITKAIQGIFVLNVMIMLILFGAGFTFMVNIEGQSYTSLKKESIFKQIPTKALTNLRFTLINFYGKIIPLEQQDFPNLTKFEKKHFPDSNKALLNDYFNTTRFQKPALRVIIGDLRGLFLLSKLMIKELFSFFLH